MDFKQIQELIKIVNKSSIGELSIEEGDFKITIKQKEEPAPVYVTSSPVQQYLPASAPTQPAASAPALQIPNSGASGSGELTAKQPDNFITIKSPMIGTFYR